MPSLSIRTSRPPSFSMIDDRQHVRQLGIAVSGMEETDIVDDDDMPETRRSEQTGQRGIVMNRGIFEGLDNHVRNMYVAVLNAIDFLLESFPFNFNVLATLSKGFSKRFPFQANYKETSNTFKNIHKTAAPRRRLQRLWLLQC